MTWAAFLLGMVGPLVIRVVAALGFSAVAFTGVTVLTDALVLSAQQNWAALPSAVINLASLSGIPEFLGMVFGALLARVAMWASVGATRYIMK